MPVRVRRVRLTAVSVAVAVLCLSSCASGPSSRTEVCGSFDDLGKQLLRGNGVFGNPLFTAVNHLGDIAVRYPDGAVSADGSRLDAIAKADSTSVGEILDATQGIGRMCGHQLAPF